MEKYIYFSLKPMKPNNFKKKKKKTLQRLQIYKGNRANPLIKSEI